MYTKDIIDAGIPIPAAQPFDGVQYSIENKKGIIRMDNTIKVFAIFCFLLYKLANNIDHANTIENAGYSDQSKVPLIA
jgi:hypothetical protein